MDIHFVVVFCIVITVYRSMVSVWGGRVVYSLWRIGGLVYGLGVG